MEDGRGLPLELWPDGRELAEVWDTDGDGYLAPEELGAKIVLYSRNRSLRNLTVPQRGAPATSPSPAAANSVNTASGESRPAERSGEVGTETDGANESRGPAGEVLDHAPRLPMEAARAAIYQVAPSRLADGVPPWFTELDRDGDGQLTLSEFAPSPTGQSVNQFRSYDRNNDGVITLEEARRGPETEDSSPGRSDRR